MKPVAKLAVAAAAVSGALIAAAVVLMGGGAGSVTLSVSLPEVYPGEMLHARWVHPTADSCEFLSNLDAAPDAAVATTEDHYRFGPVTATPGTAGFVSVRCLSPGGSGGGLEEDTTTVSVDVLVQQPIKNVGTFDTSCLFQPPSKNDDPIVFPAQPGASHLHDFLGTRGTNAFSTGEALLLEGRTDLAEDGTAGCKDVGDHAAYWAPALWRNGVKMNPAGGGPNSPQALHVYYRGNATTVSFPVGFGMVSSSAGWACGDRAAQSTSPINCFGTGRPVTMIVKFPHCWDGVNLTSTDKSHVSTANNCANTDGPDPGNEPDFPVDLPRLTFSGLAYGNINHDNPPVNYTWQLGPNPNGSFNPVTSAHADFFNAWEPFRMDQSIHLCHRTPSTPEINDLCHDDTRP